MFLERKVRIFMNFSMRTMVRWILETPGKMRPRHFFRLPNCFQSTESIFYQADLAAVVRYLAQSRKLRPPSAGWRQRKIQTNFFLIPGASAPILAKQSVCRKLLEDVARLGN